MQAPDEMKKIIATAVVLCEMEPYETSNRLIMACLKAPCGQYPHFSCHMCPLQGNTSDVQPLKDWLIEVNQ